MTSTNIPANDLARLALAASAEYKKKLSGLPKLDEGRLHECATVLKTGFWPTKIMATESDQKECHATLQEENMRRGLEACVKRMGQIFSLADFTTGNDPVTVSLEDFVLLTGARNVSAEDFR